MFKSLKDKLGESLSGTPARTVLPTGQPRPSGASSSSTSSFAPSGSWTTPQNDLTPLPISRSRTSSVSSQASDLSFALPAGMTSSEVLDLDGSFSEVETDSTSIMAMNKEELYQMFSRSRQHARHYKAGYLHIMTSYKDLEKERDKLKSTLAQTQDKAISKISELKEQLLIKSEENKDLVKSLQTQINILSEGKIVPEDLKLKSEQLLSAASVSSSVLVDDTSVRLDAEILQEKVKRLESLLVKCQETMKNNKEKIQQLTTDRENMCQQLDIKSEELDKVKDEHKEAVSLFQSQLKEARRLIEDLESDKTMSLATMKQEFHVTLEAKDSELIGLRQKVCNFELENLSLKEEIKNLSEKGEEQLKRSDDVIRKLNEEKAHLEEKTREKIEISELNLELEKDSELQELRRGKVEALQVLQQQMQEKIKELEEEKKTALKRRDEEWEEKLLDRELSKVKELETALAERQEEMMLAIEEQQLQKIAAVKQCDLEASDLKTRCENLVQDKKELEIQLEKIRMETSSRVQCLEEEIDKIREFGDQRLKTVQSSHGSELVMLRETCEAEYSQKVEDLQVQYDLKFKELTSGYELRLTESQEAANKDLLNSPECDSNVLCKDSQMTISNLQNEVQILDKEKTELKAKISELEIQVSVEKENCEHYLKQLEELEARSKSDRESFKLRLNGLIERIDHQSNSADSLAEENRFLHAELASIKTKSEETIALMRKEMEELCKTTAMTFFDRNKASADVENTVLNTEKVKTVKSDSFQLSDREVEQDTQTLVLEELGDDELRAHLKTLKAEALAANELHILQMASSTDTIKTLEQRISDLIDRENHLNVELERSKMENERNLASHNSDMRSLRSKIEELMSSEKILRGQVQVANERCEAELARASMENISALSQFSELLTESQKEMSNIIQELMETKESSNEIVASLEQELQQKCLELENSYQHIRELGGDISISVKQSNDSTVPIVDQIIAGDAPINFAIEDHVHFDESISSDMLASNFIDAADSGDATHHSENTTQSQDEQKLPHLISSDILLAGEFTSEDLLQRITELESALAEKDQRIFWFESKLKEFGDQIQHETNEMRMRSQQVELLIVEKDELLKVKDEVSQNQIHLIKDLEAKLSELNSVIIKKTSDFEELESKFWQLQSEAKSRIMKLKKRLLDKEETGEKTDVPEMINQLQEEFAAEKTEMLQLHETEVTRLKNSLEKEQQSMMVFKENVKKQFEENQEKVKFMINKLKDGCEQSLMDRDHLYQIKLMNLERDKNMEKDKVVQDMTAIIENLRSEQQTPECEMILKQSEEINFLKAELESLKVRHHEILLQFQSEKDAILKHSVEGNEHLWENIKEVQHGSVKLSEFDGDILDKNENEERSFVLEAELKKLSAENHSLHQRIVDLEKQRNAVLEMARDIRIDPDGQAATGTMTKDVIKDLESKVDSIEQREELRRLQSEAAVMVEKILLQEQHEKEVVERLEAEKKESEMRHAISTADWEKQSYLKDANIADLNGQITQLNNTMKHLNDRILDLTGQDIENVKQSREIEELINLNKQNEVTIVKLKEKILKLEEQRENQNKRNMQEIVEEKEEGFERLTKLEESRDMSLPNYGKYAEIESLDADSENQLEALSHNSNNDTKNIVFLEQVVEEYRRREDEYKCNVKMYKSELEKTQQQLKAVGEKLEELNMTNEDKNQNPRDALLKEHAENISKIKQDHAFELEKLNLEWQAKLEAMRIEQQNFLESAKYGSASSRAVKSSDVDHNGYVSEKPDIALDHLNCSDFDGLGVERVEKKIHKIVLPVVEILPDSMNVSSRKCDELKGLELHEQEMEQFRAEQKTAIQCLEDEHNSKIVQLIKDFNVQMVEREQQIKEKFREEIESLQKTEARLLSDHREQTRELHQQINERNESVKEIVQNYETQIQAADERHKDHIDKLNQIIQDLQQTLVDKEHEWVMSMEAVRLKDAEVSQKMNPLCQATLESSNGPDFGQSSFAPLVSSFDADLHRIEVSRLQSELQELKQKHSEEVGHLGGRLERYEMCPLSPLLPGMDHKDSLVALGGDDVFQLLELQNTNLVAEVNRHLIEIGRLKDREKELLHELKLMSSFSHSGSSSTTTVLSSLLIEPTEMEYLKNVLYNYMIGLETKTLAKVICTVVKFSDEQTRLILEKEETKSSKQASQQAISAAALVGGRPPSTRRLALQKSPPSPVSL